MRYVITYTKRPWTHRVVLSLGDGAGWQPSYAMGKRDDDANADEHLFRRIRRGNTSDIEHLQDRNLDGPNDAVTKIVQKTVTKLELSSS